MAADAVIAHCKAKLARFKAPKYVEFVPAVARNAAGKLDKPTLRRRFGDAGK